MSGLRAWFQDLLSLEGVPRCQVCRFPLARRLNLTVFKWQASIEASARRGCENCAILATFIAQNTHSSEAAHWLKFRPGPYFHVSASSFDQWLEICKPDTGSLQGNGPSVVHEPADIHHYFSYGTRLVGGTGDEVALSQARGWLDDCRLNHTKCQAKPNPNFVPSRLLRIHDSNEAFRLLEKDDDDILLPVAYAALSHRWSPETEAIILTTANLERRKQHGIAADDLPRVMHDAILALCRIGLSYVWIDSLCIVQDSKGDWQHEAGQMADVYSNAELTLSAAWVPDSGESLFCDRQDPSKFSNMDIGPVQADGTRPFFLRPLIPHFDADNLDQGWFYAESWPLMDRGWVYQEQLLSRRTLYFTRHELVWICQEKHACECGRLNKQVSAAPGEDELDDGWQTIVQTYSQRVLTKPSDRLPAIAGVAAKYATTASKTESPPGRYLCGLWERNLVSLLLWWARDPLPRGKTLEPMPSWSWAAVTGAVTFWISFRSPNVDVVDVSVEYHGESFVGRVKDARLVLAGPTVEGIIRVSDDDDREGLCQTHDSSCLDPGGKSWFVHHDEVKWHLHPDYLLCCSGEHSVPDGSKVSVVVFPPLEWKESDMYVCALVLQEVPGTADVDRPAYRRIGCIRRMQVDEFKKAFQLRRTLEII